MFRHNLELLCQYILILNNDLSCCLNITSGWTTMVTPVNVNFWLISHSFGSPTGVNLMGLTVVKHLQIVPMFFNNVCEY